MTEEPEEQRMAREWADDAEGAIRAMREPTDDMLRAGVRAFQHSYSSADLLADWRANFIAAIDSALKEGE